MTRAYTTPDYRNRSLPGIAHIRRRAWLASKRRPPLPPVSAQYQTRGTTMTNTVIPLKSPATEISVEDMADLRERIRTIAETDAAYSQARIARESSISTSTLSQFLGGTYPASDHRVGQKLKKWVATYDERASHNALPQGPAWVPTPTSERILSALRYAQFAGDVVVICGGAGVGKTQTIKRYAQQVPNVWHVEMSPATSGVLGCLEEIALALGIRDYSRQAAYLLRVILQKVRGTGGLLVIDEAQHLGIMALDQVRHINDKADIGLVLAGNERVYTQLTGGNRAAYLDRLYSRIGKKISIKRSSQGDADAIVKAWEINDAPCRDTVRQIAAKPGALRVLNKVLRLAATYAQAQGRKIACGDIEEAAVELGVFE